MELSKLLIEEYYSLLLNATAHLTYAIDYGFAIEWMKTKNFGNMKFRVFLGLRTTRNGVCVREGYLYPRENEWNSERA